MPPPSRWRTNQRLLDQLTRPPSSAAPIGAPSPLLRLTATVSKPAASAAGRRRRRLRRVEEPRAVECARRRARARGRGSASPRIAGRAHRAAGAVMRVLEHERAVARPQRVGGVASACLPAPRAAAHRVAGQPRHASRQPSAAGAPASEVMTWASAGATTVVARPREQHQRGLVGHRAGRETAARLPGRTSARARAFERDLSSDPRAGRSDAGRAPASSIAARIAGVGRDRKSLRRSTPVARVTLHRPDQPQGSSG